MTKKYPWQRWPDKKQKGKKSRSTGQTDESSWKKSSIEDLKGNPEEEKWIARAIKKEGALRATVQRRYGKDGFTRRGTIKQNVLDELSKEKGITGRRARLAKTLRKL